MHKLKYVPREAPRSITVSVLLNELGQLEKRSRINPTAENISGFFPGISAQSRSGL